MRKTAWWSVGGVVGVVLIYLVFFGFSSGAPVDVVEVRRGAIRDFIDERGMTRLPETYLITMPCNGRIAPIKLVEGKEVWKGKTVLAQVVPEDLDLAVKLADAMVGRLGASIDQNLDDALERIALKQTDAFVTSMQATVEAAYEQLGLAAEKLRYSEKERKRVEDLWNMGRISSEDELDRARLQVVQDKTTLAQTKLMYGGMQAMQVATGLMPELIKQYIANKKLTDAVLQKQKIEAGLRVEQAKLDETRGTMKSPVDGVVLNRFINNERTLPAGTQLLEVGRIEDLQVEADVLSLDVVRVKPGDQGNRVEIYGPAIGDDLPGGHGFARGTVENVYPAGFTKISSLGVEQQRVKVIVRFHPEDLQWLRQNQNLGVGYRVRVRVITQEKPNALVIPRSALVRSVDGTWTVYAVRKGRVRVEPVTIGILNDEQAEVVKGLAEGDLVVRAPEGELEDGQRVEAIVDERG
ncbi:MAG: efflux RND transporter periplasmic adaptor subunit [Planctomycetota bacterium]|jgi:HlyD family secretion protein